MDRSMGHSDKGQIDLIKIKIKVYKGKGKTRKHIYLHFIVKHLNFRYATLPHTNYRAEEHNDQTEEFN